MGVLLAQLNMPRIGKNIHKAAPLMETEPYFPPHWKKKCFCQSRHLISLLSSSNLLTFQANLFLLCYLSFSQDLSLCRACLKPANVVIIKLAFKICLFESWEIRVIADPWWPRGLVCQSIASSMLEGEVSIPGFAVYFWVIGKKFGL